MGHFLTLSGNSYVLVDSSSSNITITLPSVETVTGRKYSIKKITNSNNVFLKGGGNLIDSHTFLEMSSSSNGAPFMEVISSGCQWYIINASHDGARYPFSSNLIAQWSFEETSGNVAKDSIGSNHGYLQGTYDFSGNSVVGKIGKALLFDGKNYATIPWNQSLNFGGNALTVCFWFKTDSVTSNGNGMFVSEYFTNSESWGIATRRSGKNGVYLRTRSDGSAIDASLSTDKVPVIEAGGWHHIAITIPTDLNGIKMYFDGTDLSGGTTDHSSHHLETSAFKKDLLIGVGGSATTSYFNGSIDEIQLYNKVLSASEISQIADP